MENQTNDVSSTGSWDAKPLVNMTDGRIEELDRKQLYAVMTDILRVLVPWYSRNERWYAKMLAQILKIRSVMVERYGAFSEG